jgi:hypothetical protein
MNRLEIPRATGVKAQTEEGRRRHRGPPLTNGERRLLGASRTPPTVVTTEVSDCHLMVVIRRGGRRVRCVTVPALLTVGLFSDRSRRNAPHGGDQAVRPRQGRGPQGVPSRLSSSVPAPAARRRRHSPLGLRSAKAVLPGRESLLWGDGLSPSWRKSCFRGEELTIASTPLRSSNTPLGSSKD